MRRAPEILAKARQHMEDRAAARDQAAGERSMARTVAAFNALTGRDLSERDGWLFMAVLKAARAFTTPTGIPDDYEDGAATSRSPERRRLRILNAWTNGLQKSPARRVAHEGE